MSGQPRITIVLLNYRRPQNIPIILESISSQTVKAEVFLWNNGGADVNSELIDQYEHSPINVGCMARWKMAREATTPYVMSLDDDICFSRSDALESVIKALDSQDEPKRIVGFIGACFEAKPNYDIRKEFMCRYGDVNGQPVGICDTREQRPDGSPLRVERAFVDDTEAVDIVKGRSMAFRREFLAGRNLPDEREDDIFLSAALSRGERRFHRIPAVLDNAFHELREYGSGNWLTPGHMQSRNRALNTYFKTAR